MLVGLDFDNTIVNYDAIFYQLARERDWVPERLPATKLAVRDYLRAADQENCWTELQGIAYGSRMADAVAFSGVREFITACFARGWQVCVISHRTQKPFAGPMVDLHVAALAWLQHSGLLQVSSNIEVQVYFELTRDAKVARIKSMNCSVFVDDLREVLDHKEFPSHCARYLFAPQGDASAVHAQARYRVVASWAELSTCLLS